MTWWVLDNAIAESDCSAPCKHVLHTLAAQINPPPDWDAATPEAWDPARHPEALTVRYDRTRLSLLTSYSPNTLRLVMKALTAAKDETGQPLDPVLYLDRPARQHYVATYVVDLAALRRRRNPRLVALDAQRRAARQARRRGRWARADQGSDPKRSQRTHDKPPDVEDRQDEPSMQRAQDTPPDI